MTKSKGYYIEIGNDEHFLFGATTDASARKLARSYTKQNNIETNYKIRSESPARLQSRYVDI